MLGLRAEPYGNWACSRGTKTACRKRDVHRSRYYYVRKSSKTNPPCLAKLFVTLTDPKSQADDGYAYSTAYGEDEEDDDDYSIGGGVWVEPECPQGNPPTKSKEREYIGYDQHGMPHFLSTSAATPKSVHSGWASWGIETSSAQANTLRAGKPSPSVQKKTSNFAKIPVRPI